MSRWAAVLAGGSGTRFWPLSTPTTPKQFLSLVGDTPLLEQSVARLEGLVAPERILVVTGARFLDATQRLLPVLPAENILGEPRAAGTGPALTWATAVAHSRDSDASLVSLHADWFVGNDAQFQTTADAAFTVAAQHDVLVTVGVVPTRPDPSYGYIQPGDSLENSAARHVVRFTEKPDVKTAASLIDQGALWNSGLFAWTAERFFAETDRCAPEIAPHVHHLRSEDPTTFFNSVTPVVIDVSHYERSERVAVVPGDFPWDDVGTWTALSRVRPLDEAENVVVGDVVRRDADRCIVWAQDGPMVVDGVSDLVVVRANGIVLVTTKDRAGNLKELLATLPPRLRQPDRPS